MRWPLAFAGFVALGLAAVPPAAAESSFLVEGELWLDGVQRGTPTLQVRPNSPASIEVGDEEQAWRLEVEVEPVDDTYAPADTLWIHVAVDQKVDGDWQRMADSMLGVPEGEPAIFSIVDDDAAATRETATVYLQIRTTRAADAP